MTATATATAAATVLFSYEIHNKHRERKRVVFCVWIIHSQKWRKHFLLLLFGFSDIIFIYYCYPEKKTEKDIVFLLLIVVQRERTTTTKTPSNIPNISPHTDTEDTNKTKQQLKNFFRKILMMMVFFLVNMCNSGNTKHMVYEQERKRERDWAEYPESESILGRKILFEKSSFGEANSFSLVWAKLDLIFDMPHSFIHSHTSKTMIINNDYH